MRLRAGCRAPPRTAQPQEQHNCRNSTTAHPARACCCQVGAGMPCRDARPKTILADAMPCQTRFTQVDAAIRIAQPSFRGPSQTTRHCARGSAGLVLMLCPSFSVVSAASFAQRIRNGEWRHLNAERIVDDDPGWDGGCCCCWNGCSGRARLRLCNTEAARRGTTEGHRSRCDPSSAPRLHPQHGTAATARTTTPRGGRGSCAFLHRRGLR